MMIMLTMMMLMMMRIIMMMVKRTMTRTTTIGRLTITMVVMVMMTFFRRGSKVTPCNVLMVLAVRIAARYNSKLCSNAIAYRYIAGSVG